MKGLMICDLLITPTVSALQARPAHPSLLFSITASNETDKIDGAH